MFKNGKEAQSLVGGRKSEAPGKQLQEHSQQFKLSAAACLQITANHPEEEQACIVPSCGHREEVQIVARVLFTKHNCEHSFGC